MRGGFKIDPNCSPHLTINAHREAVLVMHFLPHAEDPGKFIYYVHIIVPKLEEGVRLSRRQSLC